MASSVAVVRNLYVANKKGVEPVAPRLYNFYTSLISLDAKQPAFSKAGIKVIKTKEKEIAIGRHVEKLSDLTRL